MAALTSKQAYADLKEILGLPDQLIKCTIHISLDSLITITDCEFYATDKRLNNNANQTTIEQTTSQEKEIKEN